MHSWTVSFLACFAVATAWSAEGVIGREEGRGAGLGERVTEWVAREGSVVVGLGLLREMNEGVEGKLDWLELRNGVFDSACARANAEQFRTLGQMLAEFAPVEGEESSVRQTNFEKCVVSYARAAFAREVNRLRGRPLKLKMAAGKAALPLEMVAAPERVRAAWLAWRTSIEPFEQIKAAGEAGQQQEGDSVQALERTRLFQKLAAGSQAGLWRELLSHEARVKHRPRGASHDWDVTDRALRWGILLALLADGRMEEAVGAACAQLRKEEGYGRARETYANLVRQFLTALGLDWEMIYGGFLLAERWPGRGIEGVGALANTEAWQMLGALGSARGIHFGLDWIRHAEMSSEDARPFLLRALGPAPGDDNPLYPDPRPKRREALGAEVRAQVAAAFAKYLDAKGSVHQLDRTLGDIPAGLGKPLEGPLKKLLEHRNHIIAGRALWLLRSAGLAGPDVKIASAPPPLRFRVMLDGAPLGSTAVNVRAKGLGPTLKTSSNGELVISLQDVLEPEKIDAIRISLAPRGEGDGVVSTPAEGKEGGAAAVVWTGPWFDLVTPVAVGQNAEKEIAVETGEVEVGLRGAVGVPADARVKLSLQRDTAGGIGTAQAVGKPGQSVVFRRLQVGKYRLSVQGAGIAESAERPVQVTKAGSLKLVELEAGRTIKGEIIWNGEKHSLTGSAKLFRDGVEVDRALHVGGSDWVGLPLGNYQLRISWNPDLPRRDIVQRFQRPVRVRSREIDIALTAESPVVVDLGQIELSGEGGEK